MVELKSLDGLAWGVKDGIGRIVLDRPDKANAITLAMSRALLLATDEVLAEGPRVLLITGRGPRFCAGGDLSEVCGSLPRLDDRIEELIPNLHPAIRRLIEAPLPVITALNGAVGGAGIGLALCGDFVLGAASMKFRTGYSAIGLTPDVGASYLLARRVGSVRAKQLFMLNDQLDAQRCRELGIVDQLFPDEQLEAAATALAMRFAAAATGALGRVKALCDGVSERSLSDHLDAERDLLLEVARGVDALEGIRAFTEKRIPTFIGR